ncbi:hypothetical protein DR996_07225 [Vibrio owensii]|nr:hypothetical protein DR996_07225 [Vibrio owensii]
MKIHIVQPAIPKYRISFFKEIEKKYDVCFYTTRKDFLGAKTVYKSESMNVAEGFYSFLEKFFWHRSLPFRSQYNKGDIVIINGNPRIINYMLLFLYLRFKGIHTIWWGHGWTAGSFGLSAKIRLKLTRIANTVLFYTEAERHSTGLRNAFALNNGLDSTEIEKAKRSVAIKKTKKTDCFKLVFVGRLTSKANFLLLLQALEKCNQKIFLNVIGTGEEISKYKSYSEELKLDHRIEWHGEVFEESRIAEIMLDSDAFIYTGSVGLSLIHAFNYGLPVILHSERKFHMPEIEAFKDGFNGMVFERGNVNDLTLVIDKMCSLGSLEYKTMSDNAWRTVKGSFNTEDMLCRFDSMIKEITN